MRQPVLVMTSVIVDIDDSDAIAADARLEEVSNDLSRCLHTCFRKSRDVRPADAFSYGWLTAANVNAGKCEVCGKWTTDPRLPECMRGIAEGERRGSVYYCDECISLRKVTKR